MRRLAPPGKGCGRKRIDARAADLASARFLLALVAGTFARMTCRVRAGTHILNEARARGTLDDECLRHQRDSRRPGQAGSAAAERARLMKEIAGLLNALALTRRLLRDGDDAPAA